MKFLRNLLAAILGTLIAFGIIFFGIILIASLVGDTKEIKVKNNSILVVRLDSPVKDYAPKGNNPLSEIMEFENQTLGLNQIENAIENAIYDKKIVGISLQAENLNIGVAQLQAVRKKLKEFKDSGKFIYAFATNYNQKSYYLNSVADSIFVNPRGGVDFKGLAAEILYYKDFENKFGVQYEVIRHGKYKSAVEPYLTNKMSEANRFQIKSFLNAIWEELLTNIGESRKISNKDLNNLADELGGRNSKLAMTNNLVDDTLYVDQYEKLLRKKLNQEPTSFLNTIGLEDYINSGKGRILHFANNKIAIIYAQGEITSGDGDENHIGDHLMIKAIRKAIASKNTKAIVLRVNSPGGSALTSEIIWREIELAKKKMPVVVSMSNYAASGGYYISCNANKIIAEPTTITGSIGVFGMLPNVHGLASQLGINAEQVKTNKSPNYSLFEPITSKFKQVTKEGVEQVYNTFLKRVADGRNLSIKTVDSLAQGRVWTGAQAIKIGLVDQLGDLHDAVVEAASLAGITDYSTRNYPRYKLDLKKKLSELPFISTKESLIKKEIGNSNFKLYQNLRNLYQSKGIQAKMPFVLQIN
ncbi:MAG: signal peptide peptidase SppA [Lutibacter sp.]